MIVTLTDLDTYEIAWAAAGRNQFKRDSGLAKSKRVDMARDDYQITREGLTGEWAVGQVLGLPVNTENYLGGDPGWDFEYKGLKVDVKTTKAKLLLFQNMDKFVADVAVLVRYYRDDLVEIAGVISRDKFEQEHEIRNLGYKDNCVVTDEKLTPIDEFMRMV